MQKNEKNTAEVHTKNEPLTQKMGSGGAHIHHAAQARDPLVEN